jgi:hypothetical protein
MASLPAIVRVNGNRHGFEVFPFAVSSDKAVTIIVARWLGEPLNLV